MGTRFFILAETRGSHKYDRVGLEPTRRTDGAGPEQIPNKTDFSEQILLFKRNKPGQLHHLVRPKSTFLLSFTLPFRPKINYYLFSLFTQQIIVFGMLCPTTKHFNTNV